MTDLPTNYVPGQSGHVTAHNNIDAAINTIQDRIAAGGVVLTGTGVPASDLGSDGDVYLDFTNHLAYGPKATGAWPAGASLGAAGGGLTADGVPLSLKWVYAEDVGSAVVYQDVPADPSSATYYTPASGTPDGQQEVGVILLSKGLTPDGYEYSLDGGSNWTDTSGLTGAGSSYDPVGEYWQMTGLVNGTTYSLAFRTYFERDDGKHYSNPTPTISLTYTTPA